MVLYRQHYYYYKIEENPMIRIGKLTDYVMLILSQMAGAPGDILSAASIADRVALICSNGQ